MTGQRGPVGSRPGVLSNTAMRRWWLAIPVLLAVAAAALLGSLLFGLGPARPPEVTPPPDSRFIAYACSSDLDSESNWSLAIQQDGNAEFHYQVMSNRDGITERSRSFVVDPQTLAMLVSRLDAANVPRFANHERMVGGDCLLVYRGHQVFLYSLPDPLSLPAPLQPALGLLAQILEAQGLPVLAARPASTGTAGPTPGPAGTPAHP